MPAWDGRNNTNIALSNYNSRDQNTLSANPQINNYTAPTSGRGGRSTRYIGSAGGPAYDFGDCPAWDNNSKNNWDGRDFEERFKKTSADGLIKDHKHNTNEFAGKRAGHTAGRRALTGGNRVPLGFQSNFITPIFKIYN